MFPDPDAPPQGGRLPRRATDRVEDAVAWLLTVAALLVLVFAVLSGMAAHGRHVERAKFESRTSVQARAVLREDARLLVAEHGERLPVQALARWTDGSGVEHTGDILVSKAAAAGSEVEVWLGADGEVSAPPLDLGNAAIAGIVTAVVQLLAGGALLIATWHGVRRLTAACNARRWEREWARVGPEWSSRRL
jgi:hypothetical protein